MIKKMIAVFLSLVAIPASAAIVVTGTRFVYPSDDKEISVNIENSGEKTALSQIWLTTGFSEKRSGKEVTKADIEDTPFVVLPPLFKIKPGNVQTVRILYTGEQLPADRETIFTLNILDVPPKSKAVENNLQISVLSKFKLFYRPSAIAGDYSSAADKTDWTITKQGADIWLSAKNNSAFYITPDKAKVIVNQQEYDVQPGLAMMAPFGGTTQAKINRLTAVPSSAVIKFSYVNDSGGSSDAEKTVN